MDPDETEISEFHRFQNMITNTIMVDLVIFDFAIAKSNISIFICAFVLCIV